MEFGLLGPLTVRRDRVAVAVPAGKQRILLAALLLKAGRVVPLDELIEALWGTDPPASARATLQSYVMRLRKTLGDAAPGQIITQAGGYQISVAAGELDVSRFESLLSAARAAARDGLWEEAAGRARAALVLWRGEPLAGVESELLAVREVPRLAELRLQALETRIDADLHLGGQPGEVIGELRQLTAAHPLRERLHGLLMLALYRDDRQGEALAAYQDARQVLVDELGAEPGTGLRQLHQQMLAADPALDLPGPAPGPTAPDHPGSAVAAGPGPGVPGGPGPGVPRELPAGIRHFTGRGGELKELTTLLDHTDEETPTVVISAIGGTAGVGKTALAVQWAHQVAGRFPDGQLYVNLRGYDPGPPVTAADALAGFLRALGVPGQDIPAEADERAARYRSLLAGKRMLVVLDNAGKAEQARPLLPGSPRCVVLVTSRDALAGLVARDGAQRLDLELLPPQDAIGLLRALIGERVDTEPAAAAALAERCARLPLALRVAAELAAARPATPLAGLAGELAGQQQRLDLLEAGGDPRTAVRAVFSWSYRHLDAEAARAFRLAGLHPGTDFDPSAIAALTATTAGRAGHLLEVLARAHLVQPAGPGRYGLHDLLRAYAAELAATEDSEQARRAALTGLFDYYLAAATAAMDVLAPADKHRLRVPAPARPVPPLPIPDTAQDWLDAERANLVAATDLAAADSPGHAIALAITLFRYLGDAGHYTEAEAIHTHALDAARRTGDRRAQANALLNLGTSCLWQCRYSEAADHYQRALAIRRELGDQHDQARVLSNLSLLYFRLGRYEDAVGHARQALAAHAAIRDRFGQALALGNLGMVLCRQGRYQQAASTGQAALTLFQELGHREGEANALGTLGEALRRQGRHQEATRRLRQAIDLAHELGFRQHEAAALESLARILRGQGDYQQATGHHRRALELYQSIGAHSGEAEARNGLGATLLAAGRPGPALAEHRLALALAGQIGNRYQQARAHDGLAHTYRATGDHSQARQHWQHALTLCTDLGVPEADRVRARLDADEGDDHGEPRPHAGQPE